VVSNGDGTYTIEDISLTVIGNTEEVAYYYDNGVYFADYNGYAHVINYNEVRGKVIYRAPPHPIYRGVTIYAHPR
jgi:hypothetical protein